MTDQQALDALATTAAEYEAFFASAAAGLVICDAEGRVERVNDVIAEMIGVLPEELIGTSIFERVHPADVDVETRVSLAMGTTKRVEVDRRLRREDGSYFHAHIGAGFLAGPSPRFVFHILDVSDYRRAAADRAELIGALQASNEGLDRFARSIAHDLRNPLAAIKGFAGLLERVTELDPQASEWVERILAAVDRAVVMVDGLLDVAVQPRQERTEVALDDVVQWAMDVLSEQIDVSGARIEHDPLPVVSGVQASLRHIFLNLLGNAVKYRRSDVEPVVRIFVDNEDDHLRVHVEDNGIGVPMDRRTEVFAPGVRLGDDGTVPGSGIGLASVKAAVEQHGGRVWIEDAHPQGTQVIFTLPSR